MKTQFSRRRKLFSPSVQLSGVVLGGIVVLLLLIRLIAPSFFSALTYPLFALGDGATNVSYFFSDRIALSEQVRTLTEERDALFYENESLRTQIAEYKTLPFEKGIIARVNARPPTTPYDVLLVDMGTADGVTVDSLVFAKGGVPVGVVADVSASSARVVLFSSSGRATDGWVGEDKYPVTFLGEGSGAFIAEVPREASIVEGDTTYFSSSANPFGVIVKVASDASSPQATLHIRPYVSPFSISSVVIGEL
jgi:cell shape-determining protein MreC